MKRASELLLGVPVEGEQVRLEEICDQDVIVKGVGFFESDLGPSAAMILETGEDTVWCITASTILVDALAKLQSEMPYVGRFVRKTSASDRRYWTIE